MDAMIKKSPAVTHIVFDDKEAALDLLRRLGLEQQAFYRPVFGNPHSTMPTGYILSHNPNFQMFGDGQVSASLIKYDVAGRWCVQMKNQVYEQYVR
mgnify:CR=1 FL=1